MEYLIAAVLVGLAIVLWRTNGREQYNLLAILQSTLAVSVFWMIGDDVSTDNGMLLTTILSGTLLIHFVISRFWKSKKFFWPPLFVLATSALFFVFKGDVFQYASYDINLSSLGIIMLPLLGALIEPIANAKEKVFGDFFKIDYKNRRGVSRGTFVFVAGLFFLVGHFLGLYVGTALVLLGFGSSLLYNKKSGAVWNMYLGMIAFASFGHIATVAQIDSSNIMLGRVIAGLLFGGAISLYVNTLGRARKNKLFATIISWFLFVVFPIGLILLRKVNINFGGADAFIGLLAGFGFTALLGINTRKNSSLLAIYFASGILFLPMLINIEENEMSNILLNKTSDPKQTMKEEKADIFDAVGKELDVDGVYNIDAENSQLTFKLGPKGGRTSGAFRTFTGSFKLGSTNSIQVELPVNQLTTFNSDRDESLMSDAYFNESKFPKMMFSASDLTKEGDMYTTIGKFTMLGKTLNQKLEMKYLGKTGKENAPVIIGRSTLDRRKFGMASDPSEGNIVDFTFKVELTK